MCVMLDGEYWSSSNEMWTHHSLLIINHNAPAALESDRAPRLAAAGGLERGEQGGVAQLDAHPLLLGVHVLCWEMEWGFANPTHMMRRLETCK